MKLKDWTVDYKKIFQKNKMSLASGLLHRYSQKK